MPDRGRERERKRRRRRSSDEDDNLLSGWKLGLVIGVIVVCFAMLYPTVIHPMIMSFVGRGEPPKSPTPSRPPIHPGMRGPADSKTGGSGGRHDIHPAMRMAAQQAETQSSGRGMFTWMLPIYTVGVVIFLLYTLFKSKSKRKRRSRYDSSDFSSDDRDEYNDRLSRRIGRRKLRGLQERLQQTEEAMTKILEQLEAVQAAGALIDGEPISKSRTDGNEESAASPKVDAKNEQYINDLEKALRDFKVLSEAYECEKVMRRRNSSEKDETSSGELYSGTDEESEEPVDEPERKTEAPEYVPMNESEEYSTKEMDNGKEKQIDKECPKIAVEMAKMTKKNVRRRAKKL